MNRRRDNMRRNKAKRRMGLQRKRVGIFREIEKWKHLEETKNAVQIEPGVYLIEGKPCQS